MSFDKLRTNGKGMIPFVVNLPKDRLRTNGNGMIPFVVSLSKDRLRTSGAGIIPFVVSLSNHERNRFVQRLLGIDPGWWIGSAGARERR